MSALSSFSALQWGKATPMVIRICFWLQSFLWTPSFFFICSIRNFFFFLSFSAILLVAVAYSITSFAPPFSSDKPIIAGWHKTHRYQCASARMSPQTPDLKTLVYCKIQRDLPGGDRLNQHCVNSFGLNITDINLYVKVPHSSFKLN